jgi:hypothetical protein
LTPGNGRRIKTQLARALLIRGYCAQYMAQDGGFTAIAPASFVSAPRTRPAGIGAQASARPRQVSPGWGRGGFMNRPLVLLLLAVPASAWTTSAKACWIDWYDRPNSGYCATAPPGLPLGNYFAQDARLCPENLKRSGNVLRQKPKRTSKPKSGRDATPMDSCFLSVRGICTCC